MTPRSPPGPTHLLSACDSPAQTQASRCARASCTIRGWSRASSIFSSARTGPPLPAEVPRRGPATRRTSCPAAGIGVGCQRCVAARRVTSARYTPADAPSLSRPRVPALWRWQETPPIPSMPSHKLLIESFAARSDTASTREEAMALPRKLEIWLVPLVSSPPRPDADPSHAQRRTHRCPAPLPTPLPIRLAATRGRLTISRSGACGMLRRATSCRQRQTTVRRCRQRCSSTISRRTSPPRPR